MADQDLYKYEGTENQWCPGCPNFGLVAALRNAAAELKLKPEQICLVSGIGQAAKLPQYFNANYFNGLHGRAIPAALAIQAVNPMLKTIVTTGDGDCYGEGGNHFIHAIRRNPDITLIIHNNQIYGLTKGQASPTTDIGDRTRLQFDGVELTPLHPMLIALTHGCGFIARGFTGNLKQLKSLMAEAIAFKGLSFLEVIQPCISWGTHSVEWYKERIYELPGDYDFTDRETAFKKCLEWEDRIPTGVYYKSDSSATVFGDHFRSKVWDKPLTELGEPDVSVIRQILEYYH